MLPLPDRPPGLGEVLDVDPEAYRLESHATFASHFAPLRTRGARHHYDTAGDIAEGQFHLVWPNLKINVMPGPSNLSIGPLLPASPDRTTGYLDYFFARDPDPAWLEDFMTLENQVGAEDRLLVESVHRGMRSGALEGGRLMLASEVLIHAFQRHVADGLGV